MIPPSMNVAPAPSITRAISRAVPGETALPSTYIRVKPAAATSRATSSAASGGHTDRITSLAFTRSRSEPASSRPAASARRLVSSRRPWGVHTTRAPACLAHAATTDPISPGCNTPIVVCALGPLASGRFPWILPRAAAVLRCWRRAAYDRAMANATEFLLENKVALVVGAANGICRAISLAFAGAGASVVCTDLDEAGARDAAAAVEKAGGRALAQRVDVTQSADARAAVAAAERAFGGLDVLVFGAATREPSATVATMEEADWNQTIAVNLTGAFLVSKAALPALARRGGGSIILIASQLGRVAAPERAAYCADQGRPDPARQGDGRRPRARGN